MGSEQPRFTKASNKIKYWKDNINGFIDVMKKNSFFSLVGFVELNKWLNSY